MSMLCMNCNSKTKVIDTALLNCNCIVRRRKCKECSKIFYTIEEYIDEDDIYAKEFKKARWNSRYLDIK